MPVGERDAQRRERAGHGPRRRHPLPGGARAQKIITKRDRKKAMLKERALMTRSCACALDWKDKKGLPPVNKRCFHKTALRKTGSGNPLFKRRNKDVVMRVFSKLR